VIEQMMNAMVLVKQRFLDDVEEFLLSLPLDLHVDHEEQNRLKMLEKEIEF
jgi:hypothetical protein